MTDHRTVREDQDGRTADGIAVLTLASDKVNALDVETLEEIAAYVDRCGQDPEVRALVVTGEGSIFSAGLNVSEVLDNDERRTGVLLDALNTALARLFRFAKPSVAAVNGPAIAGGCILACACDKRVMAEGARIGATELRVGVSFPVFAVELLRHACGEHAEQLIFDAALLDADEACRRYGLAAHQVVAAADVLLAAATSQARRSSWRSSMPGRMHWPRPRPDAVHSRCSTMTDVGASTERCSSTGRTTPPGPVSSGCANRRAELPDSAHGPEELLYVPGEQLGLFHGCEVAAAGHGGPVGHVVLLLDPRTRPAQYLLGVPGHPGRHVDEGQLLREHAALVGLPVEPG